MTLVFYAGICNPLLMPGASHGRFCGCPFVSSIVRHCEAQLVPQQKRESNLLRNQVDSWLRDCFAKLRKAANDG